MVNAEYGKVKLSLTLHFNEYNKFRLLLDGKEPMDFENTGKAINYVFETEVGNHILTFESIPFEKNQLGKLRFSFLSESFQTSVYKGYKQDKIEMRGDRAEMSDFPLYLNTVAGGLDRRDQTIGGFSFVVKIYAVPVVEIIG